MNRYTKIFVLTALTTMIPSVPLSAQDKTPAIIRPFMVESKVAGAEIAKPGAYTVSVGDVLELEYSYSVTPQAIPKKLDSTISESGALSTTDVVVKNIVVPGLAGNSATAFCFRAIEAGTESITLFIDGNEYHYSIAVERAGKVSEPKLCKGACSAIQFKDKVYIFANGVHPTAGYETYFQKAAIAIWPPQHSLICAKPLGNVAQVLSPFSVQTSFDATEPVASVVVNDSCGKHTVKVTKVE